MLNSHLTALSRKYPHTKFLRALASELDFMQQDPEDDTLPTVLVYRGGELETTWVRFDLELEGDGLESRDAREQVERILLQYVLISDRASPPDSSCADILCGRALRHVGKELSRRTVITASLGLFSQGRGT